MTLSLSPTRQHAAGPPCTGALQFWDGSYAFSGEGECKACAELHLCGREQGFGGAALRRPRV